MKNLSLKAFIKNLQSINSLDKSPDFKSLFISLFILFFILRFGVELPLLGGIFLLMFLPYILDKYGLSQDSKSIQKTFDEMTEILAVGSVCKMKTLASIKEAILPI